MNIIFKNSLKNIFGKPFRTILVTFAIFMCCICALLCFDLGESLTRILTDFLSNVSRADFMAYSGGSDLSELPEGYPEADYMTAVGSTEMLYKEIEGEYSYVTTDSLSIYGLDIDQAVDMEFISRMDIKDDEAFISREFAEDYGYEVGDKIIIHDRAMEEMELTVGGIFPEDTKNPILSGNSAIVNMNTAYKITCGNKSADLILIDVKDNNMIEEAKTMLQDTYPDVSTTDLFLTDSDMKMLDEIKAVFYLMFAITFLLVIFVTASICNRIVNERMSFIGTLRSLGMSNARTGMILLLENVLYALMGSLPAVILYGLVRTPMLNALFNLDGQLASYFSIPKMSVALLAGVVLMAVLIECLIPLKAILKALKISIRDIIFDNRDTEYRFSKTTTIIGLVCLAAAVVTAIFRSNIICAIICLLTAVTALAFLFPRLLKLVASGIQKLADKHDKPAWSIAASEAISRKSTVGSGVLSATAATMCIIVYAVATAMGGSVSNVPYDCDVVMTSTDALKYYSYIDHMDTVTDTEPLYVSMQRFTLNDEEKTTIGYIYGIPDGGFEYFTGFESLPDSIEKGSIVIDKKYASRKGISEGDEIKITFNPDGVFPIEKEYKVQRIVNGNSADSGVEAILLPESEYKTYFLDKPGKILIKCGDPDKICEDLKTYAKGSYDDVKTKQEIIDDNASDNSKTMVVITTIIVVAIKFHSAEQYS